MSQTILLYSFLNHIDAPKRYFSLTIDELLVAGLGLTLLVISNHKVLVALFAFGLVAILRHLKKGAHPRVLLVLAYWALPHGVSRCFLPQLPPSYQRLWVA